MLFRSTNEIAVLLGTFSSGFITKMPHLSKPVHFCPQYKRNCRTARDFSVRIHNENATLVETGGIFVHNINEIAALFGTFSSGFITKMPHLSKPVAFLSTIQTKLPHRSGLFRQDSLRKCHTCRNCGIFVHNTNEIAALLGTFSSRIITKMPAQLLG